MVIEKIVLHNVGAYYGTQVLDLGPQGNGVGVVTLVWGLNGTGKTTLLNSILFALYGGRSPSVVREGLPYSTYLERMRSRGIPDEDESFVEITLKLRQERLVIRRSWKKATKRMSDRLTVSRDDVVDTLLSKAWASHVEDIIPADLANLFVFDGEQIGEIAEAEETPPEIQRAMKTILGISTVERVIEDLERVIRRANKQLDQSNEHRATYRKVAAEREAVAFELRRRRQELAKVTVDLDRAQSQKQLAEAEYYRLGGGFLEQQTLSEARYRMDEILNALRTELLERAAGALPLALVEPLLGDIATQVVSEHEKAEALLALPLLEETRQSVVERLKGEVGSLRRVDEVFQEKFRELRRRMNVETVYDLSQHARAQMSELLQGGVDALKDDTQNLLHRYSLQQQELSYVAGQEDREDRTHVLGEVLERLSRASKALGVLEQRQTELDRQIAETQRDLTRLTNEVLRYAENLASDNEQERIIKFATLSRTLQERFRDVLLAKRVRDLEGYIKEALSRLLRKSRLIGRVAIEPETLRIVVWDPGGDRIPKKSLSSGERQMLAIALLWGLGRVAAEPLPVIIDTPMGRLDTQHRRRFVEDYLPHAGDQVVVLSTDSEITDDDVLRLGDKIGRRYQLEFDEAVGRAAFRCVNSTLLQEASTS